MRAKSLLLGAVCALGLMGVASAEDYKSVGTGTLNGQSFSITDYFSVPATFTAADQLIVPNYALVMIGSDTFGGTQFSYGGSDQLVNENGPDGHGYNTGFYDFGGNLQEVNQVQSAPGVYVANFSSYGYAVSESYSISDVTSAAPEPATWAMLLIGFGAVGGVIRLRQRVSQFAGV